MWEIVNYNFYSAHATFDFADVIFTLPNEPGCICQNPKFWLCYTIEKKAGSNSESSGLTEVKQPFQSCLIGFFCGFLCSESKKLNVC